MTAPDSVCWTTVLKLQQKMANSEPGSFWFDVYDHAIELLLSDNRANDPYILRNAVRDAKTTVRRRNHRKRQAESVHLDALDADVALSSVESDPLVVSERPSPIDEQLIARETVSRLHGDLENYSRFAAQVLVCWFYGDTIASSADQLGISRDYVKKLRKMVRSVANDLFPAEEAA